MKNVAGKTESKKNMLVQLRNKKLPASDKRVIICPIKVAAIKRVRGDTQKSFACVCAYSRICFIRQESTSVKREEAQQVML